ncbi:hypothetical protein [Algoriphagus sp. PAP.12]|nr:hypothetical protein [Algoriphagus sp. PAP.12]
MISAVIARPAQAWTTSGTKQDAEIIVFPIAAKINLNFFQD